jgi:hypothetical protein
LYYIHGAVSDKINAELLQETVSFFQSVFFFDAGGFPVSGIDFEESEAVSRRVLDDAGVVADGLACFREQERNATGSADDFLEMCAEIVVGQAVDSAVL